MRIQIQDDNQNWLNWGKLVKAWIEGATRPTNVGELKGQLTKNGVTATVAGTDQRVVSIMDYVGNLPGDPLMIVIPSLAMLNAKLQTVTSGRYPVPLFYDILFAGAARANLSPQESQDLAFRRIGEYTVNECC